MTRHWLCLQVLGLGIRLCGRPRWEAYEPVIPNSSLGNSWTVAQMTMLDAYGEGQRHGTAC